jgi:capsular exopolysaccharide synthesis family protein
MRYSQDIPADPQAQTDPEQPGIDIREYLRVLAKYKWGIMSMALIAGLIGLYSAYKAVPIYRSTAKLQIQPPQVNMGIGSVNSMYYQRHAAFYVTQYELIKSWSVAELAADKLGMLDADHLEGQVQAVDPGFSWRNLIPEALRTSPRSVSTDERRDRIIAGVQRGIQVSPVENSELVRVSIDSANPDQAARRANIIAESYIEFLKDKHLLGITSNQSWFSSRIGQAARDLENAEKALQDYRERKGLLEVAGDVGMAQNQRLQLALSGRETARQNKLALENIFRQIEQAGSESSGLANVAGLDTRGVVPQLKADLNDAVRNVTTLAQRYGPKHPKMIEAQALVRTSRQVYEEELVLEADRVVVDYQRARQEEADFSRQLSDAEVDIRDLNRDRAELTRLVDAVDASRGIYEQLRSGEKTTGVLESGSQKINASIIEFARPAHFPIRPDKQRIVMIWAALGLAVGLGLAFLLNYLDNTFKSSEEVENKLALPVLGSLPQLKLDTTDELAPMSHFLDKSQSAFSEAIRTIRTGVMLSTLDKPQTVIAITSSVPGEGKTTLAINLAHSLAQMKKTILIDADMRRPMVRKAKKIDKAKPGLSALITGEATLEEVVDTKEIDPLHIVHAGVVPANPLELLSSMRFKELINHLKTIYDVVVIDSAPALAVSDALVVSQLTDALLYVVRADATPYQAAQAGVKRVRRADAPLLGAILNRVVTGKAGYYGKYGKYGRYYRSYRYGTYGRYGYYGDYYHEYYGQRGKETEKA